MTERCDAVAVIDFYSVSCDLPHGHSGLHAMQGDGPRIKWIPEHTGSTGYVSARETWPDDSEADEAIAEAETLEEALWEIAEKYNVPVTANMPRWQEGVFLREVSDFIGDCIEAMKRLEVRGGRG